MAAAAPGSRGITGAERRGKNAESVQLPRTWEGQGWETIVATNNFISLTTEDLARSKKFYKTLGWTVNRQFTDANGACIVRGREHFLHIDVPRAHCHLHRQARYRSPHPQSAESL